MNKVNKILIIIIIILSLLLIGLGSYIVYIKVINNDINIDNNYTHNNENIIDDNDDNIYGTLLTNNEAMIILKELEEKYYDYVRSYNLFTYCGKIDNDDYISFGSYETNDFRDYWASTQFKSINELKEYYKSIMVDELIPSYIDNGISYIEQNGKLYCEIAHKGGGFSRDYDVEATYNITSIKENSIVSDVTFWGYDMSDELSSLKAVITIVKNNDNKWLVSDYEFKN